LELLHSSVQQLQVLGDDVDEMPELLEVFKLARSHEAEHQLLIATLFRVRW
jgi:hypothetical protein